MKRLFLLFIALVFCALLIASQGRPTVTSASGGQIGNKNTPSAAPIADKNDRELAKTIRRLTDRTDDGLLETLLPDGSVSLDLGGRFQNVMLSKLDRNGEPIAACVTSLEEANLFFGKNLETGEAIANADYQRESLASVASRHGMSEDEFVFYSKMAAEAVRQQVVASPQAATISINNLDGAGEGFNDPTATAAEGGNGGLTRGAQRLNVFNFAAGIWGSFLDSAVSIGINSQFNPLTPCSTSGGVLGSAGTINVNRDFANAQFAGTWYHAALANKRQGSDLVPANAEMQATFNSDVDLACLGAGTRFYYGLDNTTPPLRINLLVVVLHEMGHGLGFSSFVSGSTGVLLAGFPDIYTRYMFDQTTGLYWYQMTDAQRATSALNTNNVLWDGASIRIGSGALTAGRDATTGRVQLFTPNPFQGGSSISHFSTAAAPNLLMEPAINVGLPIDLDLTRQQMRDIGWYADAGPNTVADTIASVTPSSGVQIIGDVTNITWSNTGGFNRNVTIELSTDGGVTFPTTIAANTANTGSFAWTVPATPTTQGRIRVREVNFADPAGISAISFGISASPSAATVSVAGRVALPSGRGIARASVTLINQAGESRNARTNGFGYFSFGGVRVGESYVVSVRHKQFQFDNRVIAVNDEVADLVFLPIQ